MAKISNFSFTHGRKDLKRRKENSLQLIVLDRLLLYLSTSIDCLFVHRHGDGLNLYTRPLQAHFRKLFYSALPR